MRAAQRWQSFDLLLTCMVVADRAGQIEWVNMATQHLFERSRRSFQVLSLDSLFEDKESFQKAFETIVHQRAMSVAFVGTIAKLGDAVLVSANLHMDNDRVMMELHPVDQQILSERSIRSAREVDIYQEAFRNLAHEVKNPLGGIRGAAQLLEMELQDSFQQEYTQLITAEVDRLQQLIDRLIRPAQVGLQRTPFNIHEACERVYHLIRAEYHDKLSIRRDYDVSLPEIYADREKLVQILLNLCRNAAQALLGDSETKSPTVTLKTRIKNRQFLLDKVYRYVLVVSVIDNGPGVPASMEDRIFHPLVTGRTEGTGLGLSLAQELARQHNGVIEFDSCSGRTEFRILLPLEGACAKFGS